MYSVYQHWDPLKVCLVGRTYPPEFYSWIKDSTTRQRFETLAKETEEDYQGLIRLLEDKFGVRVLRPEFPEDLEQRAQHNKMLLLDYKQRWPKKYKSIIEDLVNISNNESLTLRA